MLSDKERFYRAIKLAHDFCDKCTVGITSTGNKHGCENCWVHWLMNEIVSD